MDNRLHRSSLHLSRLTSSSGPGLDKSPAAASLATSTAFLPPSPFMPTMVPSLDAYVEAYRAVMSQDAAVAMSSTASSASYPLRPSAFPAIPLCQSPFPMIAPPYFGAGFPLPYPGMDFARYGLQSPVFQFLPPFMTSLYCSPDPGMAAAPAAVPPSPDIQRLPRKDKDTLGKSVTKSTTTFTGPNQNQKHVTPSPTGKLTTNGSVVKSLPMPSGVKNTHDTSPASDCHSNLEMPLLEKKPRLDISNNITAGFQDGSFSPPKLSPIDFSPMSRGTVTKRVESGGGPVSYNNNNIIIINNNNNNNNNKTSTVSHVSPVICQQPTFTGPLTPHSIPTPTKSRKSPAASLPPNKTPVLPSVLPDKLPLVIPSGNPNFTAPLSPAKVLQPIFENPNRPHTIDHLAVGNTQNIVGGNTANQPPALNYSVNSVNKTTLSAATTATTAAAAGSQRLKCSTPSRSSRSSRKRSSEAASSSSASRPASETEDGKAGVGGTAGSSGVEEFRCRLCNYSGRSQHCLSKHYRAHDLAYKICRYCRRAFERPSDLLRHEERHRRRDIPGSVPLNGSSPTDLASPIDGTVQCLKIGRIETYISGTVDSSSLVAVRLGSGDNEIVLDFEAPAGDAFLEGQIPPEPSKLRDVYSIMAGIVVAPPASLFAAVSHQPPVSLDAGHVTTGNIVAERMLQAASDDKTTGCLPPVTDQTPHTDKITSLPRLNERKDDFMKIFQLRNILLPCDNVPDDMVQQQQHPRSVSRLMRKSEMLGWTHSVSICDWITRRDKARRLQQHSRNHRRSMRNAAAKKPASQSAEQLSQPATTPASDQAAGQLGADQSNICRKSEECHSPLKLVSDDGKTTEDMMSSGEESKANILTCSRCRYSTSSANKYEQHVRAHDGRFVCKACGKACIKASDLFRHWTTHGTRGADGNFACDSCVFTSMQRTAVENHMRVHYIPARLLAARHAATSRCGLCGRSVQRARIYEHKRTVHGYFFTKTRTVTTLLPVAHGNGTQKMDTNGNPVATKKRFRCLYCQLRFATPSHLLRHQFARHRHDGFVHAKTASSSSEVSAAELGSVTCVFGREAVKPADVAMDDCLESGAGSGNDDELKCDQDEIAATAGVVTSVC